MAVEKTVQKLVVEKDGNGYLRDALNNKSSKRLWASALLGIGVLLSISLYYFSIVVGVKSPATALSIIHLFFYVGGGLLGLGIFEGLKVFKHA